MIDQKEGETELSVIIHYDDLVSNGISSSRLGNGQEKIIFCIAFCRNEL